MEARHGDGAARGGERRTGAAIAAAVALLVALLLAAPILYLRIGESRRHLDQLLRRARSVREGEVSRVARIRADLDRRVEECARGQEEVLTHIEVGVQRLQPRPIVEVRIPESLPLPRDLAPAVATYDPPAEPVPAVKTGDPEPSANATPAVDPSVQEVVAVWTEELARSLGLNEMQKQRCAEAMANYLTRLKERLAAARKGQPRGALEDTRRIRGEAISAIEGVLTTDQAKVYERMKDKDEDSPNAGMILRPLPGTSVPRTRTR